MQSPLEPPAPTDVNVPGDGDGAGAAYTVEYEGPATTLPDGAPPAHGVEGAPRFTPHATTHSEAPSVCAGAVSGGPHEGGCWF